MAARPGLFDDIDSLQHERFAAHLAEDVRMRFGNAAPVTGRPAVQEVWAQFCASVAGVRHVVVEQWEHGSATVVEAAVTYTRLDDSTVTVPVVTIYRSGTALIEDYRVFIDLAPVFA